MKATGKFSLILMHDDGQTRRIRLSRGFFRFMLCMLFLLPVFGTLGMWTGYVSWQAGQQWEAERHVLVTQINETKVALERLANIEELYKRAEVALPARITETSTEPLISDSKTPDMKNGAKPAETGTPSPGTAVSSGPATPLTPGAGNVDSAAEVDSQLIVDTGVVRVENVVPRLVDPRRLRIAVDLYNAEPTGQQLSGKVHFSLLTAEGQEVKLSIDDAPFRISRFKKIVTSAALPTALNSTTNAVIKLEVFVDDSMVYRNLYPVESR